MFVSDETRYPGAFEIAESESEPKIQKQNGGSKCKKFIFLNESRYLAIFKITDYESTFKIIKLEIPDQNAKSFLFLMKLST